MALLCKDLVLDTDNPTPFFVMWHIFSDIARYWEDKPLSVEEAKFVETEMMEPLKNFIEGIEANASSEQMNHLLNKLVSSYLFLFR
jgi:type III secretory pathway component EscR